MATAARSSESRKSRKSGGKAKPAGNLKLDPKAPFMGAAHRAYFEAKLLNWKSEIERELRGTRIELQSDSMREPDANDRASNERDWSIELRRRDRQRKLVGKINAALKRLEDGEYGYCIVTGEPIALERLDARPIATMTLEAQEKHERRERQTREG